MKLKVYKVLVGTDAAIPQVRADIDRQPLERFLPSRRIFVFPCFKITITSF